MYFLGMLEILGNRMKYDPEKEMLLGYQQELVMAQARRPTLALQSCPGLEGYAVAPFSAFLPPPALIRPCQERRAHVRSRLAGALSWDGM